MLGLVNLFRVISVPGFVGLAWGVGAWVDLYIKDSLSNFVGWVSWGKIN